MTLNNENGFTLAEVLVSGMILAIGLLGIASMMASSVRGNDFGKRLTTAELLAQQRMEEFKNLSYANGKALLYKTNAPATNKNIPACGTDADGSSTIDDDADDDVNEYEAYGYEDYGEIADIQDDTITYPAFKRETLVEAANGCLNNDHTANVTVRVMWKSTQAGTPHSVTVMSMISR